MEKAEDEVDVCAECGGIVRTVGGVVRWEGDEYGRYVARWWPDHEEFELRALLRLDFESGSKAIAFDTRIEEDGPVMGLSDEPFEELPDFLRPMKRGEALRDADIDEFWHVVDHVVVEDERIREALLERQP